MTSQANPNQSLEPLTHRYPVDYAWRMGSLTTIIEYEGPVGNVRPRYWAAHQRAIAATGFEGPPADEFWRLWRTGADDAQMVRFGKAGKVADYKRQRSDLIDSTELMAMDEPTTDAANQLRVLKGLGECHLVTLSRNIDGFKATLDRLDLWIWVNSRLSLPEHRERRVEAIRQLAGRQRSVLAVAGSVPFAYAASQAGCRVVGIKGGPTYPNRLRQVGVDLIYDSLDELTDALTQRDTELQRIGIF